MAIFLCYENHFRTPALPFDIACTCSMLNRATRTGADPATHKAARYTLACADSTTGRMDRLANHTGHVDLSKGRPRFGSAVWPSRQRRNFHHPLRSIAPTIISVALWFGWRRRHYGSACQRRSAILRGSQYWWNAALYGHFDTSWRYYDGPYCL